MLANEIFGCFTFDPTGREEPTDITRFGGLNLIDGTAPVSSKGDDKLILITSNFPQ